MRGLSIYDTRLREFKEMDKRGGIPQIYSEFPHLLG